MHGVGAKTRLIPEKHLSAFSLRLASNGWIGFASPFLNRLRIALIRPLQRLLRGKIELGEEFSDRRQTETNGKFTLDQVSHHLSRP